jgi:DNA repair protein RecO (recombination protein O)
VLYRSIRDGFYEEGLFDWCRGSILTLDSLERDFSNFHLRWLLELSTELGFAPSVEDLAPFAGERLRDVQALLEAGFEETMLLPLSGQRRSQLCNIFIRYLSHHTETTLDIRSLRVLQELF